MAKAKTPKQIANKIRSLKKQITKLEAKKRKMPKKKKKKKKAKKKKKKR